jgi:diacylglycerol kinase (ATP)
MEGGHQGRDVAILANPIAGSASSPRLLDELIDVLKAQGLKPTVCRHPQELSLLISAHKESLRCVIAAGGDGTLGEVLNRAPGIPVSILPLGNENLVARYFGFQKSARLLPETILESTPRLLDLGKANGRSFALMASVGFDAEVIRRVHQDRRGHVNKLSYAMAILCALQDYDSPQIDVEIDDSGERLRGAIVLAFNLPVYPLGLPIAAAADPCDGLLNLFVFQRSGIRSLLRYVYAISKHRQARLADLQHRLVKRVHLRSESRVPVQIDGDPAGFLPVTLEAAAGAWQLLAPKAAQTSQLIRS